jgi:type IV pilus assembly protein PilO
MKKFLEDLQSLDTNDVGRWPFLFRALFVGLTFALVAVGGTYYFVWKDKAPMYDQVKATEMTELRPRFENRQRKAANYEAYKAQLEEIEQSFGAMLRQLPGKTEVPSLLVDISQTGLAAGLEEELFRPDDEQMKDFYAELPIQIRLTGTYHELARFVSDVAELPRIVTLHNVELTQRSDSTVGALTMDVTAKTYRYLEEGEEG